MDTPKEEVLRNMPYSELRKYARKSGIKGIKKAEDYITLILEKNSANEDSFDTLERKIMNSCTKNKVDRFNQDKCEVSDTPRRETYEVETPKTDVALRKEEVVMLSSSPELRPHIGDDSLNVTLTRGSERKSARKQKRKVSFVTPVRKSLRLSNIGTPNHYASTKGRPKTPIPSSSKQIIEEKDEDNVAPPKCEDKLSTPLPEAKKLEFNIGSSAAREKKASTPFASLRSMRKGTPTPNFKKIHQKAFDNMESIEDYQKRKVATSAKKVAEQKSLQDRIKAKKAGSKIPNKWGGIPFIPSVTSVKNIKTNFAARGPSAPASKSVARKQPIVSKPVNENRLKRTGISSGPKVTKGVSRENTPLGKKRSKFDLKASLSKKLPYKPHTGPLKPLNDRTMNTTLPALPTKTENSVVQARRIQSRSVLKGVRTNRRFELQMKNRSLISN